MKIVRATEAQTNSAHAAIFTLLNMIFLLDISSISKSTNGPTQAAPNIEASRFFHFAGSVTNGNAKHQVRVIEGCMHTKEQRRKQDNLQGLCTIRKSLGHTHACQRNQMVCQQSLFVDLAK
jgi:hypothetical protein